MRTPSSTATQALQPKSSSVVFLAPNIPGVAGGNIWSPVRVCIDSRRLQLSAHLEFDSAASAGAYVDAERKSTVNIGADNLLADFNIPNIPSDPSINGLNSQAAHRVLHSWSGRPPNPVPDPYVANPKVNYGFLKGATASRWGRMDTSTRLFRTFLQDGRFLCRPV